MSTPLRPRHLDSLADDGRALLAALARRPWVDDFYLAGSAALALYVAHRPVHGLDLMANANRLASPQRRDLLEDLLEMDPGVRVETARDGFLYARSGSGVALRLYYYPYPLIAPVEEVVAGTAAGGSGAGGIGFERSGAERSGSERSGAERSGAERSGAEGSGAEGSGAGGRDAEGRAPAVAVASALDLALMKVAAIISRGTRRDFVDLHLLCRAEGGALPLEEVLARSPEKFGHVRDFPLQALKGMADLAQTGGTPMPNLAEPVEWSEVEAWFRDQVRTLGRRHAGLETGSSPATGP